MQLARKARPAQSAGNDEQVERVFASDNLHVMDLATLVKARAAKLTIMPAQAPASDPAAAKSGGNGQDPEPELSAQEIVAVQAISARVSPSDNGADAPAAFEMPIVEPVAEAVPLDEQRERAYQLAGEGKTALAADASSDSVDALKPEHLQPDEPLDPSVPEDALSDEAEAQVCQNLKTEEGELATEEKLPPEQVDLAAAAEDELPASASSDEEDHPGSLTGLDESNDNLPSVQEVKSESPGESQNLKVAPAKGAEPSKKAPAQNKSGGRIRGRAARKKYTAELRAATQAAAQRKKQEAQDVQSQLAENDDDEIDQAAILRAAWEQSGVLAEDVNVRANEAGEPEQETLAPEPIFEVEISEPIAEENVESELEPDWEISDEEEPAPIYEVLVDEEPPVEAVPEEATMDVVSGEDVDENAASEEIAEEIIPEEEVIASFEQTVAAGATPANYLDFGPEEEETGQEQSDFSTSEETSFAPPEIYSNIDFGDSGEHEAAEEVDQGALVELTHARPVPDPDGPSYYSWIGAEITDPFFVLHVCYLKAVRNLLVRQFSEDKSTALGPHDFKRQLRNMGVAYNVLFDPRTRLDYDMRQMGLRQPDSGSGLTVPEDAKLPQGGGKVKLAFSELLIVCRFFNPEQILAIVNAARMLNEQQFWGYLAESGLLSSVELQSIQTAYQLICNGLITITQFEQAFQYVRMNQQQLLEILLAAGWLSFEELQEFADSPDHDTLPEAPRFFEAHLQAPVAPQQKDVQVGAILPDWIAWDESEELVSSSEQENDLGDKHSQIQDAILAPDMVLTSAELGKIPPGQGSLNEPQQSPCPADLSSSADNGAEQAKDPEKVEDSAASAESAELAVLDFSKLAQMAEVRLLYPAANDEITDEVPSALSDALSAAHAGTHDSSMDEVPASLSAALTAAQEHLAALDAAKEAAESEDVEKIKGTGDED